MKPKTIIAIRRLRNSVSGNPRWKVVFDDGVAAYTETDSALAHDVDTDWVGQSMLVEVEQRGVINTLVKVEQP